MTTPRTDLLLLGATGYTGRLVARYLATHPDFTANRFTFALGGRSPQKLAELANELGLEETKVPRVQVDVLNQEDVTKAVKNTRVVMTVVGPYWRWGKLVIKACAENGVHYLDLTGEPPFMAHALTLHEQAQSTRAVLLPCSGHDSIPADASAFLGARALRSFAGAHASVARSTSRFRVKGGISGGTIATAICVLDEVPREEMRKVTKNYAYAPEKRGRPFPGPKLLYTLPHTAGWGFYYPMAPVDRLVVQRTWALLQSSAQTSEEDTKSLAYGPDFVYDEHLSAGSGIFSAVVASTISAGIFMFGAALLFAPFRRILERVITQPGEGPPVEKLENGSIRVNNVTVSTPDAHGKQVAVRATLEGRGDPGYYLTAIMLAEAGLALALDHDALPALAKQGGVLTPMSALGEVLLERMEKTGKWTFGSEVIGEV